MSVTGINHINIRTNDLQSSIYPCVYALGGSHIRGITINNHLRVFDIAVDIKVIKKHDQQ